MDIEEWLSALKEHSVPGSTLILNIGNQYSAIYYFCPYSQKPSDECLSQIEKTFAGEVTSDTLCKILDLGFELQSCNSNSLLQRIWTFTKPRCCPSCSGSIAEC